MSIKDKIKGKICPFCSGRKLLIGFNDLQTKYPDLVASEWDYENNDCKPYDYTYKSTIKASWHCNKCNGHYKMQICFKVNGCGCPYCSGKRVLQGYNDLQSKYPELVASEWDWIENYRNHIKPDRITTGSKTKAYWKCHTCNGSYQMAVYHKTGKNKRGCPYCTGRKVLQGFNDLASQYPDLVKNEWDYAKNNAINIHPDGITCHSNMKAYWKCEKYGHSYKAVISGVVGGKRCPYCSNKKVLVGFNDLQSTHPDLINNEWDWIENDKHNIKPYKLTYGSQTKAHWKCDDCHGKYLMYVNNKTSGNKCPFCAGKQILQGYNDLASQYPDLISKEWDWCRSNKNNLQPCMITKSSHVKASWHCTTCKGSYEMTVANKISGQGCPYCVGKKVLKGFNDLQSKYPELVASEWNWVENNKHGLKPDGITKSSMRKACWHCTVCNGDYEMIVKNKVSGQGCPFCAGRRVLYGFNDLESCYPKIAKEWYQPLNGSITPSMVTKCTDMIKIPNPENPHETISVKPAWKCSECSHIWRASISSRTHMKSGCPACAKRISKQENQVAEYISNHICSHYDSFYFTMHRSIKFKKIYEMKNLDSDSILTNGLQQHLLKELDIYIPKLNFAVEYDGDYWHSDEVMLSRCGLTNSESHKIKKTSCSQAGIDLFFISEHDWLNNKDYKSIFEFSNKRSI